MTIRTKLIWWSAAIVLLMLAFVLDVSLLGDWANIAYEKVLLTLSLILVGGLVYGLFLFRRKSYQERILITIPIAAMIFSFCLFVNIVIREYGLLAPYNYFTGRADIKKGKIQLLDAGHGLTTSDEMPAEAERVLEQHFGYKTLFVPSWSGRGMDHYNSVMEDYLEQRNGKDWRVRLRQKMDSARRVMKAQ